jgi:hypothetical protein
VVRDQIRIAIHVRRRRELAGVDPVRFGPRVRMSRRRYAASSALRPLGDGLVTGRFLSGILAKGHTHTTTTTITITIAGPGSRTGPEQVVVSRPDRQNAATTTRSSTQSTISTTPTCLGVKHRRGNALGPGQEHGEDERDGSPPPSRGGEDDQVVRDGGAIVAGAAPFSDHCFDIENGSGEVRDHREELREDIAAAVYTAVKMADLARSPAEAQ